jgi:putative membrane protein
MSSNPTAEPAVLSLPDATRLAVDRTRLAFERTTMAWVRTATALISFGFTIYKFFQVEPGVDDTPGRLIGPREFAVIMISIGIFALLIGTIEHVRAMSTLRKHYSDARVPRSLAAIVGALISLLGILALTAVILRR